MSDTTAWVLTAIPGTGAEIFQFTSDGADSDSAGTVAVVHEELADLNQATISIASRPGALLVAGERCDDAPVGECGADSGIVQLRDDTGKLIATVEIWNDEPTEAGGMTPGFGGWDGTDAWVRGIDEAVKIDAGGDIVTRVPLDQPATVCFGNGALDRVMTDSWQEHDGRDDPVDRNDKPHEVTGEEELEPATMTVERWTGREWEAVDASELTDVGTSPGVLCRGGNLVVLDDGEVAAVRGPSGEWVRPPEDAESTSDGGELSGPVAPTIADDGTVFRLGDDFMLRRFDVATGELVDTGLTLEPNNVTDDAILAVSVAESERNVFACAGVAEVSNESASPGTVCDFAPSGS